MLVLALCLVLFGHHWNKQTRKQTPEDEDQGAASRTEHTYNCVIISSSSSKISRQLAEQQGRCINTD